jgi:hypothetical protein
VECPPSKGGEIETVKGQFDEWRMTSAGVRRGISPAITAHHTIGFVAKTSVAHHSRKMEQKRMERRTAAVRGETVRMNSFPLHGWTQVLVLELTLA